MTRLILIRHAETDYNLDNRYYGFSDPPLNKKGVWQSERLRIRLKDTRVDKIYSSNLRRAVQSAKIIFKDMPVKKLADLREMNFGIFEGLTHQEIVRRYPKLYMDWVQDPKGFKIPGGEDLKEFYRRVRDRLSSILSEDSDKTIALVSHGGPIRVILSDALSLGLDIFWKIEQDIAALNIIDYFEELPPAIVKMNDTSYT